MRALVWRGERDIALEEREAPLPAEDDVVVRVLAAGICGSDVGRYAGRGSAQPPPIVLGHEFAGTIEAPAEVGGPPVGTRVAVFPLIVDGTCRACRAGDENLCPSRRLVGVQMPGGFAELVRVPAGNCHELSSTVRAEAAALVEPLACALHALRRAHARKEDRLLVLGAGGIGQLVVLAASATGLKHITSADRAAGRRAAALATGAHVAIDLTSSTALEELRSLTNNEGFDLVIDAIGTSAVRKLAIALARPGGRVVLVGLHDADFEMSARIVIRDELSLIGSFGYTRRSFTDAVQLAGRGSLDLASANCDIRPLAQGPIAFAELAAGTIAPLRVILKP